MNLEDEPDQTKGHMSVAPFRSEEPVYQPTPITPKIENQIIFFEAFGVFLMCYGSTVHAQSIGFDIQFALGMMMAFGMCNHPSNSNLNLMITLCFCLRHTKRYQAPLFWAYFKAHFTGAFIGIVLTYALNGIYRFPLIPEDTSYVGLARVSLSECVGTFLLVVFVLQIVGPNTIFLPTKLPRYIFIALSVYIARRFAPTSFTALNPLITFSRALIGVYHCDWEGLRYFPFWLLGEVAGCFIGTIFFDYVLEPCIVHARVKRMIIHQREKEEFQLKSMEKFEEM